MDGKKIFDDLGLVSNELIEEASNDFNPPPKKKQVYKLTAVLSSIAIVFIVVMGTMVVAEAHRSDSNRINYDGLASYPYTGGATETSAIGVNGWGNKVHYYYEDVLYWPEINNIWELPEDAEYLDTVKLYRAVHGNMEANIYKSESNPNMLYWKWNIATIKDSYYDEQWDKIWPLYKTEEKRNEKNQ